MLLKHLLENTKNRILLSIKKRKDTLYYDCEYEPGKALPYPKHLELHILKIEPDYTRNRIRILLQEAEKETTEPHFELIKFDEKYKLSHKQMAEFYKIFE